MTELTIRQIQMASFNVLKKIDEICRKEKITYYLMYGTLIGAVRHKGFIPWDDDVDIGMPREDYERFIQYFIDRSEDLKPFELIHYKTNKDYIYALARVSDSRYHIDKRNIKDYGLGAFVDIYPLDGMGNSDRETKRIKKYGEFLMKIALFSGMKNCEKSEKGIVFNFSKKLYYDIAHIIGVRRLIIKLDEFAKKKHFEECEYVGCTAWVPIVFNRKWFGAPKTLEFEGQLFYVPSEYEKVLSQQYGDFMQLPPKEMQQPTHDYVAYAK